jgi:hypothetical protein
MDGWICGLLDYWVSALRGFAHQSINPFIQQSISAALGVSWWKRPARGSSIYDLRFAIYDLNPS